MMVISYRLMSCIVSSVVALEPETEVQAGKSVIVVNEASMGW